MPLYAGQTTLLAVRTSARQQSDMVGSSFVTDAEFNSYIQSSQQELYDLLVQKYGNDYYSALDTGGNEYRLTTNGTADHYPLPDGSSTYKFPDATTAPGFYKLLGCDLYLNGTSITSRVRLYPFAYAERNKFTAPALPAWGGRTALQYRIEAGYLWFIPLPASGMVVGVRYAPRLTVASADSDVIDGVSGWEEYIVVDAAIKAKDKEESDVSVLMARKERLLQRIEEAAENRDAGAPAACVDTRDDGMRGGPGWGW